MGPCAMRRHQVRSLMSVMAIAVVKLNVWDVLMEVNCCMPAEVSKNDVALIRSVSKNDVALL
jgi:hypothetical protein